MSCGSKPTTSQFERALCVMGIIISYTVDARMPLAKLFFHKAVVSRTRNVAKLHRHVL